MKKLFCIISIFIACVNVTYPQNDDAFKYVKSYSDFQKNTKGSIIESDAEKLIDRIEKFIAVNDKYNLTIEYKNRKSGEILLKGYYKPRIYRLYCVRWNYVQPQVSYTISIKKDANGFFYEYLIDKVVVTFKPVYGGNTPSYLSSADLIQLRKELEIIKNNNTTYTIDSYFYHHLAELHNKIVDYKKIFNDENLKKKERKLAEYSLEQCYLEKRIYDAVLESTDEFISWFRLDI